MKPDLTRLPIGEMVIGFLVVSLIVTFAFAFTLVDSGESDEEGEPTEPGVVTPGPDGLEIVMGDNFFEPTDVTVLAGEEATFALTNEGATIHNMHIASVDGEYADAVCESGGEEPCSDPDAIPGGSTGTLTWDVPADAAGAQVPFRCDFHSEMTGTISVQAPSS
jgi:plastocyanin